MVIGCGRLGGRWFDSAGRLLFFENLLFWGGDGRAARGFGPPEKAIVGYILIGPQNYTQTPKIALLALKTTRFEVSPRALGGTFLGVRADSSRHT